MISGVAGLRYQPKTIEKLRSRIEWMLEHLPHNEDVTITKPRSTSDVYRAIGEIRGFRLVKEPTWRKYLEGSVAAPLDIIAGLLILYPNMPADTLVIEAFEDFEKSVAGISSAVTRWTAATRVVADNRRELAILGKRYHADVDASPDFPLITERGWLPSGPIELFESDPVERLEFSIPDADNLQLEGLPGRYVSIKQQMLTGGRQLINGPTFRLNSIKGDQDSVRFVFSPGHYYNYINTCEVLAAELADAWTPDVTSLEGELPIRGHPARIFDLQWRSAFPGINCLLVLKNFFQGVNSDENRRTKDVFLMHQRGQATLEAQNTWHVVPAGSHQPVSEDFESDIEQSVWRTAVREFIEELFDKEEATALRRTGSDFLSLPEVHPFVSNIFRRPNVARVFYLGCGFDPVTTKPEILMCIVVNWRMVMAFDWRDVTDKPFDGLKISENYEGHIQYRAFSRERLKAEANRPHDKGSVLPAGAACLLRAADPDIFRVIEAACPIP